jgi:hypothetical protein
MGGRRAERFSAVGAQGRRGAMPGWAERERRMHVGRRVWGGVCLRVWRAARVWLREPVRAGRMPIGCGLRRGRVFVELGEQARGVLYVREPGVVLRAQREHVPEWRRLSGERDCVPLRRGQRSVRVSDVRVFVSVKGARRSRPTSLGRETLRETINADFETAVGQDDRCFETGGGARCDSRPGADDCQNWLKNFQTSAGPQLFDG